LCNCCKRCTTEANVATVLLALADFATLIGKQPQFFTIAHAGYDIDLMAGGLVVACCLLLMFTTAGGSWFNICELCSDSFNQYWP
jgi:hypothetical protein